MLQNAAITAHSLYSSQKISKPQSQIWKGSHDKGSKSKKKKQHKSEQAALKSTRVQEGGHRDPVPGVVGPEEHPGFLPSCGILEALDGGNGLGVRNGWPNCVIKLLQLFKLLARLMVEKP